jgi:hypothetical protein
MIGRTNSDSRLTQIRRGTRRAVLIVLTIVGVSAASLPSTASIRHLIEPGTCGGKPTTDQSKLVLELALPATANVDEPVPMRLTLVNHLDHAVELSFAGASGMASDIPFDIQITRQSDGSRVWQRLQGVFISAVGNSASLPSGDSLVFRDRWRQQTNEGALVGNGTYCVRGILEAEARGNISGLRTVRVGRDEMIASQIRSISIGRR